MKNFSNLVLCGVIFGLLCQGLSAGGAREVQSAGEAGPLLNYWITKADTEDVLLKEAPALSSAPPTEDLDTTFILDPGTLYQTMEGFGASMTESSAWAIAQLAPDVQRKLMQELFDSKNGLGISFLRQPMGSPDFSLGIRSYNDLPSGQTDPEQQHFSIKKDKEFIIPLLQEALRINPDLTIMASPWSPPGWMKTGGTMLGASGGVLKEEFYGSYALYFVKFIQAYQAEGIPISLVSSQNEPAYGPTDYPGMVWSAEQEGRFIRDYLGPALKDAGLSTRILGWDHNWDKQGHARNLLGNPETAKWLAGTAWHWYGGSPRSMGEIQSDFPEKELWFTEGGSGRWIGGDTFTGQFKDGIQKAIAICNNWSKSLVWWNIALDEKNGPIVFPNTANYGLVEINSKQKTVRKPYHAGWYTLGHFSRFVHAGAKRMAHAFDNQDIHGVAFVNPDGSIVLVLANPYSSDQTARISLGKAGWNVVVPGDGAITCRIDPIRPQGIQQ